jgi:hypothetical protein
MDKIRLNIISVKIKIRILLNNLFLNKIHKLLKIQLYKSKKVYQNLSHKFQTIRKGNDSWNLKTLVIF